MNARHAARWHRVAAGWRAVRMTLGLMAALLVAGLAAAPARAHQASDAFVAWSVDGDRIHQRLDLALRDLDRDLVLDADGDGRLTWREVRTRWADIVALGSRGVVVRRGDRDCTVTGAPPTPLLDTHGDQRFAVLTATLDCAGATGPVTVSYRLFAATDATHRGLARVTTGPDLPATTFAPGESVQVLAAGRQDTLVLHDGSGAAPAPGGGTLRRFATFLGEGAWHIVIGLDHVLFVGILVLAAVWRRSGADWVPRERARSAWVETAKLVSAFTVAHSVTLGLAAAGVVSPPSRWVESLIAVTVLLTALDNLRPFIPGPRWIAVALFGLVHGFGFAGPLQDLGLRGGDLLLPLVAFNLGVELGQLALVALVLPVALAWRARPAYRRWVVRPTSVAVAVLASGWTVQRLLGA